MQSHSWHSFSCAPLARARGRNEGLGVLPNPSDGHNLSERYRVALAGLNIERCRPGNLLAPGRSQTECAIGMRVQDS
jgi:hypothetical protein